MINFFIWYLANLKSFTIAKILMMKPPHELESISDKQIHLFSSQENLLERVQVLVNFFILPQVTTMPKTVCRGQIIC